MTPTEIEQHIYNLESQKSKLITALKNCIFIMRDRDKYQLSVRKEAVRLLKSLKNK